MAKVTYEFDPAEDRHALLVIQYAEGMYDALMNIDNELRSRMKHGASVSESEYAFLDNLRHHSSFIWDVGE